MRALPLSIFIPGQHDLPQHSLDLFNKCGLAVLAMHSSKFHGILQDTDWQEMITDIWGRLPLSHLPESGRPMGIAHRTVWKNSPPYPGAPPEGEAVRLLKSHPNLEMILTGDNHQPCVESIPELFDLPTEVSQRILVNPGSMMRMTAAQADYKPRVYLWDAFVNEVSPHFLPITEGVISREHIDKANTRDDRIDAFIDRVAKEAGDSSLDFKENLERAIERENISKETEAIIWQATS